jgi:hypothetical protein
MMVYHTYRGGVWRSLDKGNAARLLFPQLYRVRTLTRPLWEAPMGRRACRLPREPGDLF